MANGNGRNSERPAAGQQPPIAIVGMGCLFPDSADLKEYWRTIRTARDTIRDVPESHWDADEYFDADPKSADRTYCRRGGFLPTVAFDPTEFGIPPSVIEATDTSQLLSLLVAKATLEDGGYGSSGRDFDRSKVSVILGVTGALELVVPLGARLGHPRWRKALAAAGVDPQTAETVIESIAESYVDWQENSFPGLLGNVVAGRIANRLDLRGTNCVVDAACASSLSAVHLAVMELTTGRSDMVLTGGVDTFNDIFMYMCFSKTPALSPTGDIRPFSEDADGTIISEGVGMLLLKRLPDARRDGDRIYAVIRGIGTSSDGRSQIIYAPDARGQVQALRSAYDNAGIRPGSVQLIEAHGTGTTVGDAAEFNALRELFAGDNPEPARCALGSVKSQIGHTKAAAGAASLIKAALGLHYRVLGPTIKVSAPNPKLEIAGSPFYLSTEPRPWINKTSEPRRSGVSSFGFGGSNFHVVLEEPERPSDEIAWDGSVEILALSGDRREDIAEALDRWRDGLAAGWTWRDIAYEARLARSRFNAADAARLVLILEAQDDPAEKIRKAGDALAAGVRPGRNNKDLYVGQGGAPGKLAMLFPGQGAQYASMARDLTCMFPQAAEALADADARFDGPIPLHEAIYPKPVFDSRGRAEQENLLTRTDIAQPALAAIELGIFRILEYFGVRPDHVAGHSFGELVALHAAGRIDADALHALARLRGKLMGQPATNGDTIDRGTMLAVTAPLPELDALIARHGLDVVLANRNAPRQGVLSGSRAAIDQAEAVCRAQGFATTPLRVSGAFHSPGMADAVGPFRKALEDIAFGTGHVPVYANATGCSYPNGPDAARDLLSRQLIEPVRFVQVVENLYDAGSRTFVEVGPKAILTGLVRAILDAKDHEAIAIDASRARTGQLRDLAGLLGRLAALGHAVNLTRWERHEPPPRKPKFVVPLSGANYRTPPENRKPKRTRPEPNSEIRASQRPSTRTTVQQAGDTMVSDPHTTNPRQVPAAGGTEAPANPPGGNGQPPPATAPAAQPAEHAPPAQQSQLAEALRVAQEGFRAMQALQQQTAEAHQRFLQAQEAAQQTFHRVLASQQQMVERALGLTPTSAQPIPMGPPPIYSPPAAQPTTPPTASSPAPQTAPVVTPPVAQPAAPAQSPVAPAPECHAPPPTVEAPPAMPVTPPHEAVANEPAAAPVAASTPGQGAFGEGLLAVVGESTGYPADMLNLDMDIEEDLGIDSIKRVEILAAMEERFPNLRAIKPDYIGSLRTLRDIVEYATAEAADEPDAPCETDARCRPTVEGKQGSDPMPSGAGPTRPLGQDTREPGPIASAPEPIESVRRVTVADEPRFHPSARVERYVLETVGLDVVERGVRMMIAPGHEILVTDDEGGGLGEAVVEQLRSIGQAARLISPIHPGDLDRQGVGGLILLAPNRPAPDPLWSSRDETFLKSAFRLAQRLGPSLRSAAKSGGALLTTVTRMDGAFGLRSSGFGPVQGGLAGLAKTATREWPDVRCRALDVAADLADPRRAAQCIVDELLGDGPIETGLDGKRRVGLQLRPEPSPPGGLCLGSDDVVVVTGGARGVTADAALALARAARPNLVLLGRSPNPEPEPAWLRPLSEKPEMIAAIRDNSFPAEDRPRPAEVEKIYRRFAANREILANLKRIQDADANVTYRCVDVRDESTLRRVLDEVRDTLGPITGLVHGAGVLEDRTIADKSADQFNAVFDTKVSSLRVLLKLLTHDPLRCIVLFSSVTARFGRQGQVDYAMANEVLNKVAHRQGALRPDCRVVSINWGPWDGGMVTPALRREFQRLGVGLIDGEAGGACLVDELRDSAGGAVEVIIGSGFEPEGGTADEREPATPHAEPIHTPRENLLPVFERRMDLDSLPILESHRIGGRPVLPLAIISEWLAHAALHGNPGLHLLGLDNQHVFKGVILDHTPLTVRVLAGNPKRVNDSFEVHVELHGQSPTGADILHAGGTAVLADAISRAPAFQLPPGLDTVPYPRTVHDAYEGVLFHGPDLRGIEQIIGCSPAGIMVRSRRAPKPHAWMSRPVRTEWIGDPLAVDVAYQAGLLWAFEETGVVPLPSCVVRYRQYQRRFPATALTIALHVRRFTAHKMTGDVFFLDDDNRLVAEMGGVDWIAAPALRPAVGHRTPAGLKP